MSEKSPRAQHGGLWGLTGGSLSGLLASILAGVWVHRTQSPGGAQLVSALTPIGAVWVDALRQPAALGSPAAAL